MQAFADEEEETETFYFVGQFGRRQALCSFVSEAAEAVGYRTYDEAMSVIEEFGCQMPDGAYIDEVVNELERCVGCEEFVGRESHCVGTDLYCDACYRKKFKT